MTRALPLFLVVLLVSGACGNRTDGGDVPSLGAAAAVAGGQEAAPAPVDNGGATDVGVTATELHIGVIADLTGVVPGLFEAAVQGVEAYAAKVNEEGGIHGRRLVVDVYDTGTSDAGNGRAYETACDEVFASVGSESAFDSGGHESLAECGFPHLPGFSTDPDIGELDFVLPRASDDWEATGYARWLAEQHPDAVTRAAYLYVNTGAAERGSQQTIDARESVGWRYVHRQQVAPLESNYTPHVLEMRSRDVDAVSITSDDNNIVRLIRAMREQGFDPTITDLSTQAYTQEFLDTAGPGAESGYLALDHLPFEDRDTEPAMDEYLTWLERTSPGAVPSSNGLRAWAMAMLFTEAAEAVGPAITREALLDHLRGVTDWDAGGLLAPRDLDEPIPSTSCFVVLQVRDGAFVRAHPDEGFDCSPDYVHRSA